MRVVAYSNLRVYGDRHPDAKPSLRRWHRLMREGHWRAMQEVVGDFGTAKMLNDERCRFAIHGGNCRLIVAFNFEKQVAYIKFIGSHAEYDKIDAFTVSQF